ncbi:MAG: polysaccharide biosynthesis/export family protein [Kiritimatiellia bacterium]
MASHLSRRGWLGVAILAGIVAGGGCAHPSVSLSRAGPSAKGANPGTAGKPKAISAAASANAYALQVGDEIDIQVYREPELSGAFKISPAGEIRHPLLGSVSLAGRTVDEAEAFFTQKLAKDYLVNPRVIVKLLATQSSQIVLMGEVKKPGVYPLPFGGTTTLLQAIAGAGGFTELASPDRVRIVRRLPDGRQTTLKFRVSDLLKGGKQQDVPLEPNDVIMVPEVVF